MCYYAVSLFICGCELRKFERCSHQPTSSHIIEDVPRKLKKACCKCQPKPSLLGKCQQPRSSIGKGLPRTSLRKRKRDMMSAECAARILMGIRGV